MARTEVNDRQETCIEISIQVDIKQQPNVELNAKKHRRGINANKLAIITSSADMHTCTEPPSLSVVVISCETRLPTDGAGVS